MSNLVAPPPQRQERSQTLRSEAALPTDVSSPPVNSPMSVNVWGVPFTSVDYDGGMALIEDQIESRVPGYFITANMHYLMVSDADHRMRRVNTDAAFILADGMPIVWRSRSTNCPIPERVAGSDLIYSISELAAKKNYSIYFLGGAPGVAQSAADILQQKHPRMRIAGVESPPFRELTALEEAEMTERIRTAKPDILLVAFGQPKGELWIHKWYQKLEVPLSVQLGGSFNFVTGEISRSPQWVARIGMEWFYRFYKEPLRLGPRYVKNWLFLAKALFRDATNRW